MKIIDNQTITFEIDAIQRLNQSWWFQAYCNIVNKYNKKNHIRRVTVPLPLFCDRDSVAFCVDSHYLGFNTCKSIRDLLIYSNLIKEKSYVVLTGDQEENYSWNVIVHNVSKVVDIVYATDQNSLSFWDSYSLSRYNDSRLEEEPIKAIDLAEKVFPSYYYCLKTSENNYYYVNQRQIVLNEDSGKLQSPQRDYVVGLSCDIDCDALVLPLKNKDTNVYFSDNLGTSSVRLSNKFRLLMDIVCNSNVMPTLQKKSDQYEILVESACYQDWLLGHECPF